MVFQHHGDRDRDPQCRPACPAAGLMAPRTESSMENRHQRGCSCPDMAALSVDGRRAGRIQPPDEDVAVVLEEQASDLPLLHPYQRPSKALIRPLLADGWSLDGEEMMTGDGICAGIGWMCAICVLVELR